MLLNVQNIINLKVFYGKIDELKPQKVKKRDKSEFFTRKEKWCQRQMQSSAVGK